MASAGKIDAAMLPMSSTLQRYFEIALYLSVSAAFGTLASTGGVSLVAILLVSAALLIRGYLLIRSRTWLVPEHWTAFLTLGYVAFYVIDYYLISGGFLNATVHLVLFVMVVRLFSAQRDRDFYFLSIIAFLMVLAAALLTVDSIFLLAFAVFMLMSVVSFILMEMRHISGKAAVHSRQSSMGTACQSMATSLAVASPVLVLCILLLAAGIFFLLPRASAGYLGAYSPGGGISTGFSDTVELGRIGEIQQSSSVVMHIQIDGDKQGSFDLKWRGVALSNFDGRTWTNIRGPHPLVAQPDGHFMLARANIRKSSCRQVQSSVLMEPVGMNVFFLAGNTQSLEGDYRHLAVEDAGAVFNLDPERPVNRYQATSDIAQAAAADLRRAERAYPRDVLADYLGLPVEVDSRIPLLAQQITAAADNPYDKALALETYLRTHFVYTLQLPRTVPHDH